MCHRLPSTHLFTPGDRLPLDVWLLLFIWWSIEIQLYIYYYYYLLLHWKKKQKDKDRFLFLWYSLMFDAVFVFTCLYLMSGF